jgi:hypothetical protein
MEEFLVETYVARGDGAAAARGAERARDAAERLKRDGTPVRFLRSIFVPDDETCFYLYEAASAGAVEMAAAGAALRVERVSRAIGDEGAT